jgi:hypothetical protein
MSKDRTPNNADLDILKQKYAVVCQRNDIRRRLTLIQEYAASALRNLALAEEAAAAAHKPKVLTRADIDAGNNFSANPAAARDAYHKRHEGDLAHVAMIGVELAESIGMIASEPGPDLKLAGTAAGE